MHIPCTTHVMYFGLNFLAQKQTLNFQRKQIAAITYEKGQEDEEERDDSDHNDISPPKKLASGIREFMETALSKCIPKGKRESLAKEYPQPDIPEAKIPRVQKCAGENDSRLQR